MDIFEKEGNKEKKEIEKDVPGTDGSMVYVICSYRNMGRNILDIFKSKE